MACDLLSKTVNIILNIFFFRLIIKWQFMYTSKHFTRVYKVNKKGLLNVTDYSSLHSAFRNTYLFSIVFLQGVTCQ